MRFTLSWISRKSGNSHREYVRLRWSIQGKQKDKTFSSESEARKWAKQYLKTSQEGGIQLSPQDAQLWRVIQSQVPEGFDVMEIWERGLRDYEAERQISLLPEIQVSKAISEWLDKLKADEEHGKISYAYLRGIRSYMNRVINTLEVSVRDLDLDTTQMWLDTQDLTPKGKKNMRGYLNTFLKWCHAKGYSEIQSLHLTVPKQTSKDNIGVFTPTQLKDILKAFPDNLVPPVVIGAFAGLRTSEINRLEWKDIRGGHIHLSAAITKTGIKRVVPIQPNLQAWLDKYGKKSGSVVDPPVKNLGTKFSYIRRKLGLEWVKNGLRHSFCSYRLAMKPNAAAVSLEAGNTPTVLLRRYNEAVTKPEAEKWFSIKPEDLKSSSI